jgi:hypothetical protein
MVMMRVIMGVMVRAIAAAMVAAMAMARARDWFSSCVDQYSMLLYQKIKKCSTSLHNELPSIFLYR